MLLPESSPFIGCGIILFYFPFILGHRFCSVTYINEVYTANCAYRGRVQVPRDLDPDIKVLVLSHNNIERIDEDCFSNYDNLVELYLNDNTLLNNSFHKNALLPLTNLRILDISFIRYHIPLDINWPSWIEKLSINKNRNQHKIDLSKISNLRTLNAIDCSLSYFPIFNESAPVEQINLSKNSLNHLSVGDLASLCHLQILHLQWTAESTLNGSERWCDCLKIDAWIKQRQIQANELNCSIPRNVDVSACDVSFREEKKLLEECFKKSIKTGKILGYVFLSIISVSIIVYIWYSRMYA